MAERENQKPSSPQGRVLRCDEWEDLIADALDNALPAADAAAFARHHEECVLCAQMLKETQQGRDWMQYLAVEPEVPADLLQKILARTSGFTGEAAVGGLAQPAQTLPAHAWRRGTLPSVLHAARQFARHALEPRLMMTVAMAFFSIALTLNLTGVNLRQIRPADLQPSHLRVTLTRQYYATNEQVTKYYLNLRLVYEMEARVRELRRSTETEPAALQPRPSPDSNPRQPSRDGSPSSTVPKGEMPVPDGGRTHLKGEATLPAMLVHSVPPPSEERVPTARTVFFRPYPGTVNTNHEVFRALPSTTEDQAKRSLA